MAEAALSGRDRGIDVESEAIPESHIESISDAIRSNAEIDPDPNKP